MLTQLNGILDTLAQGPSFSPQRPPVTSKTSGGESDNSRSRRKHLKKMFKMQTSYREYGLGKFFVTGPTDAATESCHFCCRICRKNLSVLNHGHPEVLRIFKGARHFLRDQRLRLQTLGWRILDYQIKSLTEDELDQEKHKIRKCLSIILDHEHPFKASLIVDDGGVTKPNLLLLTKFTMRDALNGCSWSKKIKRHFLILCFSWSNSSSVRDLIW